MLPGANDGTGTDGGMLIGGGIWLGIGPGAWLGGIDGRIEAGGGPKRGATGGGLVARLLRG